MYTIDLYHINKSIISCDWYYQVNKVNTHTTVHMDMQRNQPPPTSVVMTSTTEVSDTSTPTSVFQNVIVQPGHLVQIPKTQSTREENAKNNGILCKFYNALFLCN